MYQKNKNILDLSIVIPAYNEETNIRLGSLDKVFRYFEHQSYKWEIVIVNDGSTDDTQSLLDDLKRSVKNLTIIHNRHLGKAGTVIKGMQVARGNVILFTDLDQATPINEIEKLIPWFANGYDVVIGSRSGNRQGAPVMRLIMARGFMLIREIILGLKGIKDTQCGFKAFHHKVINMLLSRLQLYQNIDVVSGSTVTAGFDVELLYITKQLGFKIKEVPVEWHYVDTRHVNPFKDSFEGLRDIINIKINDINGKYKFNT
jgi:dolichyl-phosphate beta-glucosyltransferase